MVFIENTLGVSNIVDGGYGTVFYTKGFLEYIDDRRQTVGGAGGGGDYGLVLILVIVNAHDDI